MKDQQLYELFQDTRHEDEQQVPSFESMWETVQAKRQVRHQQRARCWWAAAAIFLALVAATVWFSYESDPVEQVVSITVWESPTRSLASYPGVGFSTDYQLAIPTTSLGSWQAPTRSLLQAPKPDLSRKLN